MLSKSIIDSSHVWFTVFFVSALSQMISFRRQQQLSYLLRIKIISHLVGSTNRIQIAQAAFEPGQRNIKNCSGCCSLRFGLKRPKVKIWTCCFCGNCGPEILLHIATFFFDALTLNHSLEFVSRPPSAYAIYICLCL